MIAETIPEAYDADGRKVSQPFLRRKGPHPTFPMGRYFSRPLTVKCENLQQVRRFLASCGAVTDKKLFGKDDYWQPPDEFEKLKKGDCDDFALWTWRQLLSLGYDARFVLGRHGRYGIGHAWVTYFYNGKCFLVEPQAAIVGNVLPRLSTIQYHPKLSVSCNGEKLSYYRHSDRECWLGLRTLAGLCYEWLVFWGWFWFRALPHLPTTLVRNLLRRFHTPKT